MAIERMFTGVIGFGILFIAAWHVTLNNAAVWEFVGLNGLSVAFFVMSRFMKNNA